MEKLRSQIAKHVASELKKALRDPKPQPKAGSPDTRSKKTPTLIILEQWIEVRSRDGNVSTALTPSNEDLLKQAKNAAREPDLVYRRLHFPDGVPEPYDWAVSDPETRRCGGAGVQRMTFATWREVIEAEQAAGTGHIGPTGVGNLPRPKQRGECTCRVCVFNAELQELLASEP